MAFTIWDQLDQYGFSISNGNLTATRTSGTGNCGVRSFDGQTSGKYYFEVQATALGNNDTGIGITNGGFSWAAIGSAGAAASVGIYANGRVWANTSLVTTMGTPAGHTVCVAVDLDNLRVWIRIDGGAWVNSGDPASNTSGLDISGFNIGPWLPIFVSAAPTDACTANFGDTAFSFSVPAGFTSGWPATITASGTDFISGPGAILSNSNRTVQANTPGNPPSLIKTGNSASTGKVFFQYFINAWAGNGSTSLGVANSSATGTGVANNAANAFVLFAGQIWLNGANLVNISNPASGEAVDVALDFTHNRGWIRRASGNWNGSGTANPATNTGGFDISAIDTSPLYASFGIASNDGFTRISINSSSQAKTTPPVGFSVGFNNPQVYNVAISEGMLGTDGSDVSGGIQVIDDQWDDYFVSNNCLPANYIINTTTAFPQANSGLVVGLIGHQSGRWYFEMFASGGNGSADFGIANSLPYTDTFGAVFNTGVSVSSIFNAWRIGGNFLPTGGPNPSNETIGFAVDFGTSQIWWRRTVAPTVWYGANSAAGDPVAGTFGQSFATAGGIGRRMYIAYGIQGNGNRPNGIMNAGRSSFAAAPPTGYLAWQDLAFDPFITASQTDRAVLRDADNHIGTGMITRETARDGTPRLVRSASVFREVNRDGPRKIIVIQPTREVLKSLTTAVFLGLEVDMAELYFAPGVFIDFSDPANRAKFHDSAHHPIPLGSDASLPTGDPPLIYLSQVNSDLDPLHFPNNRAENGALTLVATDGKQYGYGIAPTNPTD